METKAQLTKRLQDAGIWEEVQKFRDSLRKELRGSGLTKAQASAAVWEATALRWPPDAIPGDVPGIVPADPPKPPAAVVKEAASGMPDQSASEASDETEAPVEFPAGSQSYWEALDWAASAIGRASQGQKIGPASAPSATAYGLYTWGMKAKEKFYGLWAAQAAKNGSDARKEDRDRREARLQVEEIDAMIEWAVKESQRPDSGVSQVSNAQSG